MSKANGPMSDVLVVGAGVAGLSCARRLQQAGWAVTVVDKGRQPGGRVASREIAGLMFDHGAQFLSVRDPAFEAALEPARRSGALQAWQAPGRSGNDWVGVPAFRDLPKALAAGLTVHSSTEVRRIERREQGWAVTAACFDGSSRSWEVSALVLTVPAPQIRALLGDEAPPALERIAYAPSWTLMVRADRPLSLPEGADPHPHLGWICEESRKPGRSPAPRWTVQASADWSTRHLEVPVPTVSEAVCEMLSELAAVPAAAFEVLGHHRWRYARVTASSDGPRWWSDRQLGLAGDGFAGPRIESAWQSGWALAGQMMEAA